MLMLQTGSELSSKTQTNIHPYYFLVQKIVFWDFSLDDNLLYFPFKIWAQVVKVYRMSLRYYY